jgi:transcriptional regulator with XRE-family HTH domain
MVAGYHMRIGESLRQARQRARITQVKAAEALGISQVTVSSWELGRTRPQIEDLPRVARVYRTTVRELVAFLDKDPG